MATHEQQHVLRILHQASNALYPSEIAELINHELRLGAAFTRQEVIMNREALEKGVTQLIDGRWARGKISKRGCG
jgi:hypothetical protein